MKKTLVAGVAALAALASVSGAQAQVARTPFSVEVRAQGAVPTGDFKNVLGGIGTGYGVGVTGELALTPMLGVYAGYSYTGYDLDLREETLDETGVDAGVRASFGSGVGLTPFLKGGVVYHKLETELAEGESRLGFEVGGGVDYPLGNVISVTPALSYSRIAGQNGETDVSAVRLGVGLRFRL